MIFNPANSITMKHEPALGSGGGAGGGDGSSIEVAKRPRGRPPGSKNRPKPPIIITRDSDTSSALKPHILEIPNGHDVIHSLQGFSRQKNLGLCVLAASGAVANLTLRQPPHPTASVASGSVVGTVCFNGRFEILSMSTTIMPPGVTAAYSPSATVTVAAAAGQVLGGTIVGPMVAAGTVTVVAAGFENPSFIRLPILEEDEVARSGSLSGGGEDKSGNEEMERKEDHQDQRYIHREYSQTPQQQQQQQRVMSTGAGTDSCGVGMFGSHYPTDVIWGQNARPTHPPPY